MLEVNKKMKEMLQTKNLYVLTIGWDANALIDKIVDAELNLEGIICLHKVPFSDRVSWCKSILKRVIRRDRKRTMTGKRVLDYKKLNELEQEISIVLGFSPLGYDGIMRELVGNSMISKIYVLNGASYLHGKFFKEPESEKVILLDDYIDKVKERGLTREYYEENEAAFLQTYEWLTDERSQRTMQRYIEGSINYENFPLMSVWNSEEVKFQYFDKDIVKLSKEEVFIDCGAYTGDTLSVFDELVDGFKKYYAFEPDTRRFKALESVIKRVKGEVVHIKKGVWDKAGELRFSIDDGCGEICFGNENKNKTYSIPVDTIDGCVDSKDKVSFIKMDIEGSELNALSGAKLTIKRDKPTLAICVYHKKEDLITIPQYIKALNEDYKFYLRTYYPYCAELVLYAVCE